MEDLCEIMAALSLYTYTGMPPHETGVNAFVTAATADYIVLYRLHTHFSEYSDICLLNNTVLSMELYRYGQHAAIERMI